MKKNHKIALIWTQYTLMLYMLIADDWKKTLLFLYQGRIGIDIVKRIHEVGGRFWGGYWLTSFTLNRSRNIFIRILRRVLYVIIGKLISGWIKWVGSENIISYGYETIFCSTKFLDAGCYFSVLEDGESTYLERLEAETRWSSIDGVNVSQKYLPGGWSEAVDEVILTGRKKIPVGLEKKVRLVDLEELWSKCSEEKREEIIHIFQFDFYYWKKIISEGRDIVLLTTNHFVHGITSDGCIALYNEILSHYDRTRVIIKPHPTDFIDYEHLFPDCLVIRQTFPFEMCRFSKLKLKKIVGVKSTALYGIWPENMVDDYTELLEKYKQPTMNK